MTYIDDEFYDHYNDPDHDCDLNISQCRNMTPWEEGLRDALRDQMLTAVGNGSAAPDVRVVDVPLLSTLVMNDNQNVVGGVAMTIGHRDVGDTQNEVEFRARLIFNFGAELAFPDGFDETDLIDAQVIVFFSHDSVLLDPENPSSSYFDDDRGTDVITLHKMLNTSTDFWNTSNYVDTPLGQFEPAPHIIAIPFDELPEAAIRVLPMPSGTPVSFGHNADLLEAVESWLQTPTSHYGSMIKAEKLTTVANGDQEVSFMRQAVLRLTFKRNVN